MHLRPMRIFLWGLMGSGKSTLGAALATQIDYPYIDLDQAIVATQGRSIADLFASLGEAGFRALERQALLAQIAAHDRNLVLACGGGTPSYQNNAQLMNEAGLTVYLKVSPAELARRLAGTEHSRPLLAVQDGRSLQQKLEDMLLLRLPYYELARLQLADDNLSLAALHAACKSKGLRR